MPGDSKERFVTEQADSSAGFGAQRAALGGIFAQRVLVRQRGIVADRLGAFVLGDNAA